MAYHNRSATAQGIRRFLDQIVSDAAAAEKQARDAIGKIMVKDLKNATAQGWELAPGPRRY